MNPAAGHESCAVGAGGNRAGSRGGERPRAAGRRSVGGAAAEESHSLPPSWVRVEVRVGVGVPLTVAVLVEEAEGVAQLVLRVLWLAQVLDAHAHQLLELGVGDAGGFARARLRDDVLDLGVGHLVAELLHHRRQLLPRDHAVGVLVCPPEHRGGERGGPRFQRPLGGSGSEGAPKMANASR